MRISENLLLPFQRLTMFWSVYSGRLMACFRSLMQIARKLKADPLSNIYHRCNDTPLSVFIACSVEKDYRQLAKKGNPSKEKLYHAWDLLYSEYSHLTGGQSYKLLLNLSKDIAFLEGKLLIIGLCLRVLAHRPDPVCIRILEGYGYRYEFDPENLETYEKNMKALIARSGAVQLEIAQKRKEIEAKQSKVTNNELTRETYINIIAVLSKHMGFKIVPEETTVSEFVAYRKNYEHEIEAIKKYQQDRKDGKGRSNK